MRYRILTPLLILLLSASMLVIPVNQVRADEYPDVPVTRPDDAQGDYDFPQSEPSLNPDHISDAIVSLNVTGANFVTVLMLLTEQAGVNFILDAYWNTVPSGHIREDFRPPGGPDAGGNGGGFGGGGGFDPQDGSGGGTVTMHISESPFDTVFKRLMQAYNLDYIVYRDSVDTDPLLYIGTRERLQTELGLGSITMYNLSYIDPQSAVNFLYQMDLMPSTSGYGVWYYGGGGGSGSGGGGGGSGFGGPGGSGGGGSGFGGGGAGFSEGLWTAPRQFAVLGLGPDDLEGRSII